MDITVEITTHDDDPRVPAGAYGVLISTPSDRSETGMAHTALLVEDLDEIGEAHVDAAAYSLAAYETDEPGRSRARAQHAYREVIRPHVLEAVARYAA